MYCADIVSDYNKAMGGVDLTDMLISLYRTNIKSKRWYLKVIFHCIDIAKVNGWLLYRRFADLVNLSKKKQFQLLKFVSCIGNALTTVGKELDTQPVGRPSKRSLGDGPPSKRGCKPSVPVPISDIRYDAFNHWPDFRENKNRCRQCKTGYSRVYCTKCNLCLCFTNGKNCFRDFHKK